MSHFALDKAPVVYRPWKNENLILFLKSHSSLLQYKAHRRTHLERRKPGRRGVLVPNQANQSREMRRVPHRAPAPRGPLAWQLWWMEASSHLRKRKILGGSWGSALQVCRCWVPSLPDLGYLTKKDGGGDWESFRERSEGIMSLRVRWHTHTTWNAYCTLMARAGWNHQFKSNWMAIA